MIIFSARKRRIRLLEKLGIQRVTIDLPFKLNHVHCFLAEGENGWKIIDTGLHNEKSIKAWSPHLEDKKITDLIITHCHPDHIGYAGQLQLETGASVWMSETDAELSHILWADAAREELISRYVKCGVDPDTVKQISQLKEPLIYPLPVISGYLNEGDKIRFGKYEYEVIFTPGHSDGLFVLFNREKKVLLSTDHILPKITPNISLRVLEESNPLDCYFRSLLKIKTLDIEYAIPSHGDPFFDVHNRIEEIESHHQERLEFILNLLEQPKTAVQVCEQLFRKNLTMHELRFAIGETLSHLVYLINKGLCRKNEMDGKWYYFK